MPVAPGRRRRRGEWGTLVPLSGGRAQVRWSCPLCSSPGDSVKHRSEVVADLTEAGIVRNDLRAKFARGPASICTEREQATETELGRTVRNAHDNWLKEVTAELSPSTLNAYETMWSRTVEPRWGDREVSTINNPGEVSAWRAGLAATYSCRANPRKPALGGCTAAQCGCSARGKCSPICDCRCGCVPASKTSVATAMSILSGILAWAVENNWTDVNAAAASYGRRRRRRGRLTTTAISGAGVAGVTRRNRPVATVEAAHAVAARMPDRYELIPLLACYAGLRLSEILGLRRSDVDRKACELHIAGVNVMGKGGMKYRARQKGGVADADGRAVQIPDQVMVLVVKHLKEHVGPEPTAWLWPSPRPKKSWTSTKCIGNRYVARMVATAREYAGLADAVTLPALRKTGENLVKAAVGGDQAALWAGHDLGVAEDAYHLQMTRVNDPKAVRKALTAAWPDA